MMRPSSFVERNGPGITGGPAAIAFLCESAIRGFAGGLPGW